MTFKIDWQGSPNFDNGRAGQQVCAIVDHIMQSSIESANGWFKNQRSEVSAHFGVAKDGRIWQWVGLGDTAWANGPINKPDTSIPWLKFCVQNGINPNTRTVSIEHEGFSGQAMPELQYQATLWLHTFLLNRLGLSADREHIIGHYQIDRVNRPNCPGPAFPFERLVKDLNKIPDKVPTSAPAQPAHNPNPDGFAVGDGVRNFLTAQRGVAKSDEQFYVPAGGKAGLAQRSFTYADNGLYIAYQELNPDGSPALTWYVERYELKASSK